ncbi:hypothetical protein SAZ11_33540 [Streptomyces sp. FXJ1.4098]|nr:hypothetical protein [Streptomyces sp. FXJ1.4098]
MADDHRYSWLDDDAAERLLRGEPAWVQPSDLEAGQNGGQTAGQSTGQNTGQNGWSSQSRSEAERLAAVLDAVAEMSRPIAADGTADGKPLPGEEAALAAFRAVRAEQAEQAARTGKAGQAGRAALRSVRFGADGGSRPRGTFRMAGPSNGQARLRRPLHMGLVAALAGCALSGFAVATAAGVLPFGPQDSAPGPSVSMPADTSGESAEPNISPDGTTPGTGGSPDNDASGGAWYGSGGSPTSPGQGHEAEGGTDGKGEGNNGKDDPRRRTRTRAAGRSTSAATIWRRRAAMPGPSTPRT